MAAPHRQALNRHPDPLLLAAAAVLCLSLVAPMLTQPTLAQAGAPRATSRPPAPEIEEPRGGADRQAEPPVEPVEAVCPLRLPIAAGGATLQLPYCADGPLDARHPAAQHAVVVVHGSSRNADDQLGYIRDAAASAGVAAGTFVVAPHFLEEPDVATHALATDVPFWVEDGWKQGDRSDSTAAHPRAVMLSSFGMLDAVLARLANRASFPNLRDVVVAGHSAGGQLVNRYATAGAADQQLRAAGIRVGYLVANPSSYLYLTPERPGGGAAARSALPDAQTRAACPDYDDYKYGLRDLNSYTAAVGAESLKAHYAARPVAYLLGGDDITPEGGLDTGCRANLQGRHRLERGNAFVASLGHVFGSAIAQRHVKEIVPNVGHNARAMFASAAARRYLLGGGIAALPRCAPPSVRILRPKPGATLRRTVRARGKASAEKGCTPLTLTWDLGDPSTAADRRTGPRAKHTYPAPGPYTIRLTATNREGLSAEATVQVTIR